MVSNLFRVRFVSGIVLVYLPRDPLVWKTSQLKHEIDLQISVTIIRALKLHTILGIFKGFFSAYKHWFVEGPTLPVPLNKVSDRDTGALTKGHICNLLGWICNFKCPCSCKH